jgi:hypothetical protein
MGDLPDSESHLFLEAGLDWPNQLEIVRQIAVRENWLVV